MRVFPRNVRFRPGRGSAAEIRTHRNDGVDDNAVFLSVDVSNLARGMRGGSNGLPSRRRRLRGPRALRAAREGSR